VAKKKKARKAEEVVGFVGVGLDDSDGQTRITRSEYFVLLGGSPETHGRMQDTAVKFTEALHRRGKDLENASAHEVIQLFREADA
jgi:hypothetical protein